jgi:hypothetical protein
MLPLWLLVILGVALFLIGVSVGAIVEGWRSHAYPLVVVQDLKESQQAMRKSLRKLRQVVDKVDDDLSRIAETKKIPVVSRRTYSPQHTMELIDYETDEDGTDTYY